MPRSRCVLFLQIVDVIVVCRRKRKTVGIWPIQWGHKSLVGIKSYHPKAGFLQVLITLQQRRRMVPWAALGEVLPSFPSTQHQWGHTWSAVSSSGLASICERWTLLENRAKGLEDDGMGPSFLWGRAERAGALHLEVEAREGSHQHVQICEGKV